MNWRERDGQTRQQQWNGSKRLYNNVFVSDFWGSPEISSLPFLLQKWKNPKHTKAGRMGKKDAKWNMKHNESGFENKTGRRTTNKTWSCNWNFCFCLIFFSLFPLFFLLSGPPASPSDLECFRPCDETECHVDIQCTWLSEPDPESPTNHTLHWEAANSK